MISDLIKMYDENPTFFSYPKLMKVLLEIGLKATKENQPILYNEIKEMNFERFLNKIADLAKQYVSALSDMEKEMFDVTYDALRMGFEQSDDTDVYSGNSVETLCTEEEVDAIVYLFFTADIVRFAKDYLFYDREKSDVGFTANNIEWRRELPELMDAYGYAMLNDFKNHFDLKSGRYKGKSFIANSICHSRKLGSPVAICDSLIILKDQCVYFLLNITTGDIREFACVEESPQIKGSNISIKQGVLYINKDNVSNVSRKIVLVEDAKEDECFRKIECFIKNIFKYRIINKNGSALKD